MPELQGGWRNPFSLRNIIVFLGRDYPNSRADQGYSSEPIMRDLPSELNYGPIPTRIPRLQYAGINAWNSVSGYWAGLGAGQSNANVYIGHNLRTALRDSRNVRLGIATGNSTTGSRVRVPAVYVGQAPLKG